MTRPIPSGLAIMLPPAYIARPDKLWGLKAKYPDAPDQYIAEVAIRADAMGIDPLVTPIYIIKRESKSAGVTWTLQASIDAFRAVASAEVIVGHRPTDYAYGKEGNLIMATVWGKKFAHGGWHEVCASALWSEYVQTDRNGVTTGMWTKMAHTMLAKCAEALLLRRSCPAKLAGLYTGDEMGQAGNVIDVQVSRAAPQPARAIEAPRAAVTPADAPKAAPAPAAAQATPAEPAEQTRIETIKRMESEHVTKGGVTVELFRVVCESGNIYQTTSTGLAASARTLLVKAEPASVTFIETPKGLGLKAIAAAPSAAAHDTPWDDLMARAATAGIGPEERAALSDPKVIGRDFDAWEEQIAKAIAAAANTTKKETPAS